MNIVTSNVGNTYGRKLESGDVLEIYDNNLHTDNCDFDARIYVFADADKQIC